MEMPRDSRMSKQAKKAIKELNTVHVEIIHDDLGWLDQIAKVLKQGHWDYANHVSKGVSSLKDLYGTFSRSEIERYSLAVVLNSGNLDVLRYSKTNMRDERARIDTLRINEYYHSLVSWKTYCSILEEEKAKKFKLPLVDPAEKKGFYVNNFDFAATMFSISLTLENKELTKYYYDKLVTDYKWSDEKIEALVKIVVMMRTACKVLIA